MNDDPLLTVKEIAHILRVAPMSVYRLIRAGDIKTLRVGKVYRIRQSEFDRFLREST